ncbi:MAG: Gldg family protein [Clostridia bacterium]|nr:Gldg family protein [Clostridia bacterium]
MKKTYFRGKSAKAVILSLITVVIIVAVFALNVVLNYVGTNNLAYLDMTPEGLYTVSDGMEEFCREILDKTDENGEKKQIEITFCTDLDYIVRSEELRVTYFMALALSKKFDNLSVKSVNVTYNPTAVAKYKTTSRSEISPSDIIISYGNKYRIATSASFWTTDTDGNDFSYNGEYKLASILASLAAINSPVAYFVTDHGETFYNPDEPESEMSLSTAYFADLLTERGLRIETLVLSEVDEIPDDCALLIINNPTRDIDTNPDKYGDYSYVSDAEKIDRFLIERLGSLIVNKAYDVKLPVLESLLSEWGIAFGEGIVEDEAIEYSSPTDDDYNILGVYDTDDESFGSAFYGDYSGLSSAPDMLFRNSGYIYCSYNSGEASPEPGGYNASKTYASFIGTTDDAIAVKGQGDTYQTAERGFKSLCAVSTRTHLDSITGENDFSYVLASNSEYFYSNDILGNTSFANYDILASLITTISRTERYAPISLGGSSPNSTSFGGKQLVDMTLRDYASNVYSWDGTEVVKVNKALTDTSVVWYTVIAFVAPITVIVLGFVIVLKRRHR